MIEARKSRWFSAWFARHCEGRIRASFEAVHVHGLEVLAAAGAQGSVLIVSNHTAWWDPLVAIWLTQRLLALDSYAMMNAANLRRLPFFAKMGAFGVDLADPRDGARALRYSARLLRNERPAVVWIFAQGDERPITEPLEFRRGSTELARLAPRAAVVPLAIRYEMGNTEKPRLLVSIGTPLAGGVDRAGQEAAVRGELERIESWVRAHDDSFTCIMQVRPSFWGKVAERILSWVTRSALQPALGTKHQGPSAPP